MTNPQTLEDWLNLPNVEIPAGEGIVILITKVGVMLAPEEMAVSAGIRGGRTLPDAPGLVVLPTAAIDAAGSTRLFRLPVELGEWAIECCALAKQGVKSFPSRVSLRHSHRGTEATFFEGVGR